MTDDLHDTVTAALAAARETLAGGTPSIKAVLASHEIDGSRLSLDRSSMTLICKCGVEWSGGQSSYMDHLAAVLSAREALVLAEGRAEAVREFLSHYASQLAYNGAGDPEQALYDYGVNGSLLRAADEWLRRANPESEDR